MLHTVVSEIGLKNGVKRERGEVMKFNIDHRSPVYLQVIHYFKEKIASGELAMGEEIPSRRELARTLKINPNTVQRAYKEMEEAELIYTDGNLPSKVTKDERVIQRVRQQLMTTALDEFVDTMQTLHMQIDEIIPLLQEKYDDQTRQKKASKHETDDQRQKKGGDNLD